MPSATLGLHLFDRELCLFLQYWLKIRINGKKGFCLICHCSTDPMGDHQVGCDGNNDQIARHNFICDSILSAAWAAAFAPRTEVSSQFPGTRSRPENSFLPIWSGGCPAAPGVTIIFPMKSLNLECATITPGHALCVTEERKLAAQGEECCLEGVNFIPLVLESLGAWPGPHWPSAGAATWISPIGGCPPSGAKNSIPLWRGNATLWTTCQHSYQASVNGIL